MVKVAKLVSMRADGQTRALSERLSPLGADHSW